MLGFQAAKAYSKQMKVFGILFIVFGLLWTVLGFASYKSDIQLGIAISGINMMGIGCVMFHLANTHDKSSSE